METTRRQCEIDAAARWSVSTDCDTSAKSRRGIPIAVAEIFPRSVALELQGAWPRDAPDGVTGARSLLIVCEGDAS